MKIHLINSPKLELMTTFHGQSKWLCEDSLLNSIFGAQSEHV